MCPHILLLHRYEDIASQMDLSCVYLSLFAGSDKDTHNVGIHTSFIDVAQVLIVCVTQLGGMGGKD